MAEKGRRIEWHYRALRHFQRFKTDSETCWLLEVGSLTNPPDSVISSPKTKGSTIPQAEWSCSSEDSANVSQGRTNVNIQSTPEKGEGGANIPCMA